MYIDIIYREADIARTVRRIRNANIRAIHKPGDSYDNNYPEGVNLVRRIYKHQGIDSTPRLLGLIDLNACQKITRDTPEYQMIIDNPMTLPGLPQAA